MKQRQLTFVQKFRLLLGIPGFFFAAIVGAMFTFAFVQWLTHLPDPNNWVAAPDAPTALLVPMISALWITISSIWAFRKIKIIEQGQLIEAGSFEIKDIGWKFNKQIIYRIELKYSFQGKSYAAHQMRMLDSDSLQRMFLLVHQDYPGRPLPTASLPDQLEMQLFTSQTK